MFDLVHIAVPTDDPQAECGRSLEVRSAPKGAAEQTDHSGAQLSCPSDTTALRAALSETWASQLASAVAETQCDSIWTSMYHLADLGNSASAVAAVAEAEALQDYLSAADGSDVCDAARVADEAWKRISGDLAAVTVEDFACKTHENSLMAYLGTSPMVDWLRLTETVRTMAVIRMPDLDRVPDAIGWLDLEKLYGSRQADNVWLKEAAHALHGYEDVDWAYPKLYTDYWRISATSYAATAMEAWKDEKARQDQAKVDALLADLSGEARPFWTTVKASGAANYNSELQHLLAQGRDETGYLQVSKKRRSHIIDILRSRFGQPDTASDFIALRAALATLLVQNGYVRQTYTLPPSPMAASLVHDQILGHQLNTGVPPPSTAPIHALNPAACARPSDQKEQDHGRHGNHHRPSCAGYSRHPDLFFPAADGNWTCAADHPPVVGCNVLGGRPGLHRSRSSARRPLYRARGGKVGRVVRLDGRSRSEGAHSAESIVYG